MQATCPRCSKVTEYTGEPPLFCAYCGQPLNAQPGMGLQTTASYVWPVEGGPASGLELTTAFSHGVTPEGRPAEVIPERLSKFRLLRKIGAGGMGSVHEAEDESNGRRVAIKLIAPHLLASDVAVERFLQEGRLASAITHPRCVFVLAADAHDGHPYIVMELMSGTTLKDLVESGGPVSPEEAVAKILDVMEGLGEAHRLGVIHRDVKPSNCFLEADGRVKVGDFGLSKSLITGLDLTHSGSFLGTPLYASPEQIRGEALDSRTDVYSVAATLYFLITGKAPFEAKGKDAASTLAMIISEDAPSIRQFRPDVSKALDRAIMKGLSREKGRRYRDLPEFARVLAPFLPSRLSIGGIGLRIVAFVLEMFGVRFLMYTLVDIGWFLASGRPATLHVNVAASLAIDAAYFAYFALMEGFYGASLAKRFFGLRVYDSRRTTPPGLGPALMRTTVFFALTTLPADLLSLYSVWQSAYPLDKWVTFLRIPGLMVITSTMRASNGFRGLHELVSETRVIRLRGRDRFRSRIFDRGQVTPGSPRLMQPGGIPAELGPYQVEGALSWDPEPRVLHGNDAGLGRPVWVVLRAIDDPPASETRREVNRIGRPRWISGGEEDDLRWDAFIAPGGRSLPDLVRSTEMLTWREARPILETLSEELAAACDDATLPPGLSVDSVWVLPNGQIQLTDVPAGKGTGPEARPGTEVRSVADRALRLLFEAATLALTGRRVASGEAPAPIETALPLHVRGPLDQLCGVGPAYAHPRAFHDDLEKTHDRPTCLTPMARLVGLGAFLAIGAVQASVVLLPMALVGIYIAYLRSPEAGDSTNLAMAESLTRMLDQLLRILPAVIPLGWAVWAFVTCGGLTRRLAGTAVVGLDGRPPSRLQHALREATLWAIFMILAVGPVTLAYQFSHSEVTLRVAALASLALLLGYAAMGVLSPRRMLHDVLAGTTLVPR
jgi:uncharacterized RDD family membrane protein YckC